MENLDEEEDQRIGQDFIILFEFEWGLIDEEALDKHVLVIHVFLESCLLSPDFEICLRFPTETHC